MPARGIPLFKFFGFSVRIDLSWFFLAFLITWTLATGFFPFAYPGLSYGIYLVMGLLVSVGLFFSVLIHEFAHAKVGEKFGLPMRGITLFLFGGLAEMEHEAPTPKAEFLMALAGPATSVLVFLLFWGLSALAFVQGWPTFIMGVLSYLAILNAILVIFNMIPAFPLDGGRVLRAALWQWKDSIYWATRVASRLGSWFGIFLMIWGVFGLFQGNFIGGIWRILIGLFLKNAAEGSYRQMLLQKTLENEPVGKFVEHAEGVPPDIPLQAFIEQFLYVRMRNLYPVVEDGRLVGCLRTDTIKEQPADKRASIRVRDIMEPCPRDRLVDIAIPAADVLSRFNWRTRELLVMENGQYLGVVSLESLMNFVSVKEKMETP